MLSGGEELLDCCVTAKKDEMGIDRKVFYVSSGQKKEDKEI